MTQAEKEQDNGKEKEKERDKEKEKEQQRGVKRPIAPPVIPDPLQEVRWLSRVFQLLSNALIYEIIVEYLRLNLCNSSQLLSYTQ